MHTFLNGGGLNPPTSPPPLAMPLHHINNRGNSEAQVKFWYNGLLEKSNIFKTLPKIRTYSTVSYHLQ